MMSKFNDLITGDVPVLVDFFAEWCGPCKAMAPVLQEVAKEFGDKLKIIKVDVDKNQAAAQKYSVRAVPTLILFHKGQIKGQQSGALSSTQLSHFIKQQLS